MVDDVPFALAVSAGSVAALNPCGFALLPAYLSLLVVGAGPTSRREAVVRACITTAAMTLGFTVVFVTFGLVLAPVAGALQQRLPWFTVALGAALVGLGGWLLAGRSLPGVQGLGRRGPALTGRVMSMALFGGAYALASLSCTIGPFLAIVVSAFRAGSPVAGVGLFGAYAAGMGLVVGLASVSLALSSTWLVGHLRRLTPVASRLGGLVMVASGAYVAYYGWYERSVLRGGDPADPVIEGAVAVQQRVADAVGGVGAAVLVIVLVLLVAGALVVGQFRRRPGRGPDARRAGDGSG